jgi:hypothetical protein
MVCLSSVVCQSALSKVVCIQYNHLESVVIIFSTIQLENGIETLHYYFSAVTKNSASGSNILYSFKQPILYAGSLTMILQAKIGSRLALLYVRQDKDNRKFQIISCVQIVD